MELVHSMRKGCSEPSSTKVCLLGGFRISSFHTFLSETAFPSPTEQSLTFCQNIFQFQGLTAGNLFKESGWSWGLGFGLPKFLGKCFSGSSSPYKHTYNLFLLSLSV